MDLTASRVSVIAAVVYLGLTALRIPHLPFVRFPAFAFPDTGGQMAVPLFHADGAPPQPEAYTDFSGFSTAALELRREDLPSVVEHRFHQLRTWVGDHPGDGGPVQVSIGVRVLRAQPDGSIAIEDRVEARGTAQRR